MSENSKKKKIISKVFLCLFPIGLIIFNIYSSSPNFKKARQGAREKACYSNIRVIQGAVEMYNMDSPDMMQNLNMHTLIAGNYLKEEPLYPEVSCGYLGSNLDNNGSVFCEYHGDLQGLIEGRYTADEIRRQNINNNINFIANCLALGWIFGVIFFLK